MANVTETAQWEAGIYQLETTDKVVGGATGISNRQAKLLANRTGYLKAMRERGLFVPEVKIPFAGSYAIGATDAGKFIKFYSSGPTSVVIPTISSDVIKVGETVTIMNANTDGDITLVMDFMSPDIMSDFFDNYTTHKVRPMTAITLCNSGVAWEFVGQHERQKVHGVGEVLIFATNRSTADSRGLLPCNGAAVSRTTYASLFAIIGTTFGVGDGSTTFNVPNYPLTLGGSVPARYYIRF